MRPQQQNRRMRGRGNNNRKGPNPLSRSYESNGPDVKIRGTAQQVAEKYTTLARDAQSSGDRVIAENYLQHAEHYNRIIAAAQAQQQQQQQTARDNRDDDDDDANDQDEREVAESGDSSAKPRQRVDDGTGPQPEIEGTPAEVALNDQGGSESKANGHSSEDANGVAASEEKPKRRRRTATAKDAGADEGVEKPVRRTRRPKAVKSEDVDADASAAEAQRQEEVAAQG